MYIKQNKPHHNDRSYIMLDSTVNHFSSSVGLYWHLRINFYSIIGSDIQMQEEVNIQKTKSAI